MQLAVYLIMFLLSALSITIGIKLLSFYKVSGCSTQSPFFFEFQFQLGRIRQSLPIARFLHVAMIAFHWRLFLAASLAIENYSASKTSTFIFTGLRMELRSALTRSSQVHFMPPPGRFQSGPFTNSGVEFGRVVGSWRSTQPRHFSLRIWRVVETLLSSFKYSTDVRRLDRATLAENVSSAFDRKAVQVYKIRCLESPSFTAPSRKLRLQAW